MKSFEQPQNYCNCNDIGGGGGDRNVSPIGEIGLYMPAKVIHDAQTIFPDFELWR